MVIKIPESPPESTSGQALPVDIQRGTPDLRRPGWNDRLLPSPPAQVPGGRSWFAVCGPGRLACSKPLGPQSVSA
ncbi:MAG: hypothetical protein GX495_14385 [Chloroflexi bacterium]|nr:hypothetical protein [Chloroflexota bacterium]